MELYDSPSFVCSQVHKMVVMGVMDPIQFIAQAGMVMVPFILALCIHEYAHGRVAQFLGDPTAKMMGRLTLNPVAHADPIGTVALPLLGVLMGANFFFGWAKPVPVNPRNLKNEKVGMFWVALAGPASNLILGFIGAFLLAFTYKFFRNTPLSGGVIEFCKTFIGINLTLAFFNLIPLNPLDGGKIIAIALPDSVNQKLEDFTAASGLILLMIVMLGGLQFLAIPINATYSFFLDTALAMMGLSR